MVSKGVPFWGISLHESLLVLVSCGVIKGRTGVSITPEGFVALQLKLVK